MAPGVDRIGVLVTYNSTFVPEDFARDVGRACAREETRPLSPEMRELVRMGYEVRQVDRAPAGRRKRRTV